MNNRNLLLSFAILFSMVALHVGHLSAQSSETMFLNNLDSNTVDTSAYSRPQDITAYTDTLIPLKIRLFPEYPRPGEKVIAKVEGFETDLPNDIIEWSADGAVLGSGPGKTTITFNAPDVGNTKYITARAIDNRGRSFSATYTITPNTVDLVWETDTYTPPFFEGKALQSSGSKIRLTAFATIYNANLNLYTPSELIYTWRQNNKKITELSGRGRQSVTISNDNVVGPLNVTVDVTSPDDVGYGGRASLNLEVIQPKIVFYEDHPLMGIRYETALPVTTKLSGEEVQIVAEPYYFTADRRNADDLEYSWLINGAQSRGLSNTGSAIVLKGASNANAAANIDVRIRNKTLYMQSARQAISVISSGDQ